MTFNCNNQKIIILNQEKVILQLNDEVAKLKSHVKTLTKVPKEKKEEFLKDYKYHSMKKSLEEGNKPFVQKQQMS